MSPVPSRRLSVRLVPTIDRKIPVPVDPTVVAEAATDATAANERADTEAEEGAIAKADGPPAVDTAAVPGIRGVTPLAPTLREMVTASLPAPREAASAPPIDPHSAATVTLQTMELAMAGTTPAVRDVYPKAMTVVATPFLRLSRPVMPIVATTSTSPLDAHTPPVDGVTAAVKALAELLGEAAAVVARSSN